MELNISCMKETFMSLFLISSNFRNKIIYFELNNLFIFMGRIDNCALKSVGLLVRPKDGMPVYYLNLFNG